jgi:hypothetical protein
MDNANEKELGTEQKSVEPMTYDALFTKMFFADVTDITTVRYAFCLLELSVRRDGDYLHVWKVPADKWNSYYMSPEDENSSFEGEYYLGKLFIDEGFYTSFYSIFHQNDISRPWNEICYSDDIANIIIKYFGVEWSRSENFIGRGRQHRSDMRDMFAAIKDQPLLSQPVRIPLN